MPDQKTEATEQAREQTREQLAAEIRLGLSHFSGSFSMTTHDLPARTLKTLMQKHRVTIRELAKRLGMTQKAVRRRRQTGIAAPGSFDWRQAVVGAWTEEMATDFRTWRGLREP